MYYLLFNNYLVQKMCYMDILHVITCITKLVATKLELKIKKRDIHRYLADQNIVDQY